MNDILISIHEKKFMKKSYGNSQKTKENEKIQIALKSVC